MPTPITVKGIIKDLITQSRKHEKFSKACASVENETGAISHLAFANVLQHYADTYKGGKYIGAEALLPEEE